MIKKLCLSLITSVFAVSASFWAYSPNMTEQKSVEAAWTALMQIIDTKHSSNYNLLLWLLESFQTKVAGDERKVWILETLINIIISKIESLTPTEIYDAPILENVVWSKTIRWISFDGTESWWAQINHLEYGTKVLAKFWANLPDPGPDNFYEWWIVRQWWWLSVLSTWEAKKWTPGDEDTFINDRVFRGDLTDYTDHTFYVLTLEPNDGDPAPADHILEAHVR